MAFRLKFEHEFDRLAKDLGKIGNEVVSKAAAPAINRVTKSVRSVSVKAVSKVAGMKQKDVGDSIKAKLATRRELSASVDATAGRAVSLRRFISPKQREASGGPGRPQFFRKRSTAKSRKFLRKGIKAKAWGKVKTYGGAFVAKARSGNVLPFLRTGRGRNSKLKVLRGPSIRREFNREPIREAMERQADERFPIEMDRSIKNQLRRLGKK